MLVHCSFASSETSWCWFMHDSASVFFFFHSTDRMSSITSNWCELCESNCIHHVHYYMHKNPMCTIFAGSMPTNAMFVLLLCRSHSRECQRQISSSSKSLSQWMCNTQWNKHLFRFFFFIFLPLYCAPSIHNHNYVLYYSRIVEFIQMP